MPLKCPTMLAFEPSIELINDAIMIVVEQLAISTTPTTLKGEWIKVNTVRN